MVNLSLSTVWFVAAELLASRPVASPDIVEPAPPVAAADDEALRIHENAHPDRASKRQRQVKGKPHRTVHELKDPSGWPAEPAAPEGSLDLGRFESALIELCRPTGPSKRLAEVAKLVHETAAAAQVDPFLLGALA